MIVIVTLFQYLQWADIRFENLKHRKPQTAGKPVLISISKNSLARAFAGSRRPVISTDCGVDQTGVPGTEARMPAVEETIRQTSGRQ
jgi:hypothetical protein